MILQYRGFLLAEFGRSRTHLIRQKDVQDIVTDVSSTRWWWCPLSPLLYTPNKWSQFLGRESLSCLYSHRELSLSQSPLVTCFSLSFSVCVVPVGPSRCGGLTAGQCEERAVLLLRGKRWTFMCLDRWSLRANFFSQTWHWYGFTPECERRWRESSSERENLTDRQTQSHVTHSSQNIPGSGGG